MLFHIGDVLTITSGYMLSPDGEVGLRRLMSYLTGRMDVRDPNGSVGVDEMRGMAKPCSMAEPCFICLSCQHPHLRMVVPPDDLGDGWAEWVSAQAKRFGEFVNVRPMANPGADSFSLN